MHLLGHVQPRDGAVPSLCRPCPCCVQVLVLTLLPVSAGGRGDQHSVWLPDSGQSRKSSSFYVLSFFRPRPESMKGERVPDRFTWTISETETWFRISQTR